MVAEPVTARDQAAASKRGVFEKSLGDPKALAATVSGREEVALFGSAPDERTEGGAKVKAELLGWKLAFKVRDGIQAGLSESKNVGWVAANVDATAIEHTKNAAAQPYRVLVIYEKTGDAWKLVQASFSVDPR